MILYATTSDLTGGGWVPSPLLGNAEVRIRQATVLVAVAAGRNPYDGVQPTGADAAALRDATCAQVAAWVASGVDPSSGVAGERLLKRSEILSGKLEYDTSAQAAARKSAAEDLAAEAVAILTVAGLLVAALPLFDSSGALPSWGLDAPSAYRWPWPSNAEWPLIG